MTPVQTFCYFHSVKSTLFLPCSQYKKKVPCRHLFPKNCNKASHVCASLNTTILTSWSQRSIFIYFTSSHDFQPYSLLFIITILIRCLKWILYWVNIFVCIFLILPDQAQTYTESCFTRKLYSTNSRYVWNKIQTFRSGFEFINKWLIASFFSVGK